MSSSSQPGRAISSPGHVANAYPDRPIGIENAEPQLVAVNADFEGQRFVLRPRSAWPSSASSTSCADRTTSPGEVVERNAPTHCAFSVISIGRWWTPAATRSSKCCPGSRERLQPSGDTPFVGVRNYLVEGVSATGKTSVCRELNRRGYQAIHGDRELAYQGDPETGEPTGTADHEHHIWDVDRLRQMVADHQELATFFCGGSRNFPAFLDLFDEVFVLDVDSTTLHQRLDERPQDEWGSSQSERELIARLHRSREDIPRGGVVIDATRPLKDVVDDILRRVGLAEALSRDA